MTKVNYFLCKTEKGVEKILYGTSKMEINHIGEKMGLGKLETIEEKSFKELKKSHGEEILKDVREASKPHWINKSSKSEEVKNAKTSKKEAN